MQVRGLSCPSGCNRSAFPYLGELSARYASVMQEAVIKRDGSLAVHPRRSPLFVSLGCAVDPAVAHSTFRRDVPRRRDVVAELSSELTNVDPQVMTLVERVSLPPHASKQPLMRQELPRVGDERLEQCPLGGSET